MKPREKKLIPIEAPFIEEISRMAIIKIVDKGERIAVMLKLKFIRYMATLDMTNNTQERVIFDKNTMIGMLDLRLLGYYKIKQGVLQQNLSKYYHFEETKRVCDEFNKMVNVLKKEETQAKEKYPWLDDSDEGKCMTDKEILDKYMNLEVSCLTKSEKKRLMEMLYDIKTYLV